MGFTVRDGQTVFPQGVTGIDWLWIGLAVCADIAMWRGGTYGNRSRIRRAYRTA